MHDCSALPRHARALLLAALLPLVAVAQQDVRGFTADDLVRLERVSEPRLSPDGTRLAYVLRETDMEANRGRTDLLLLDLRARDASPVRLTRHEANDSAPRWSPDGRTLYFLSARGGRTQVWSIRVDGGGEPQQVTDFPLDVGTFRLSPRGDRLIVSMQVFRDCRDLACTRARLDAREKEPATGKTYDQLFARHWDTWRDGRRSALFSVALGANGRAGGAPVNLSGTLDGDVPSTPFGGAEEYGFSPDGERVVFAARAAGREEAWSTNLDVYEVPVGGGEPRNLTADNPATDTQPAYSPDGRWLAWLAMSRAGFEADRYRIMLLDRQSGAVREVAPRWDRSPHNWTWAPDSRSIYVSADELGNSPLFRVQLDGRVARLTEGGTVGEIAVAGPSVVYVLQHLASPPQLHALERRGSRVLTTAGAERLAGVRLGQPEQFSFRGARGETVFGWVVRPWNHEPGRRYPIAFIVHGGPQVSFANNWSFRWNPQVYAGAGYGVVFIDFHGSPGYGQAFTDSISGQWGGLPFEDLQLGLAAALERFDWLDGERACALGASYGGYMVNWIAGRWPERFRCLVNHAGLFDQRSMYYTTEELWFTEWEQGGPYFQVPEQHEQWNPANHVTDWRTPMLVIHGLRDFRVPYSQGLATFTALQRRGIESRLLVFPDENHWVLKPHNSLQWHREVLTWLDRHLQ